MLTAHKRVFLIFFVVLCAILFVFALFDPLIIILTRIHREYPYKARDGTCKEDSCGTLYSPISNYNDVTSDDSTDLMDNAANGCVSVAVDASDWQFYSRGVYSRECGDLLDHGVLVVGYGSDDGDEYWKVKNSWGKTWGMEGYILLCRDCGHITGECGILREPSYPDPKDSKQSVSM